MSPSAYRVQNRGGRGVTGMKTKEEDFVEHLFVASTHAYIMFLTSKSLSELASAFWIPVFTPCKIAIFSVSFRVQMSCVVCRVRAQTSCVVSPCLGRAASSICKFFRKSSVNKKHENPDVVRVQSSPYFFFRGKRFPFFGKKKPPPPLAAPNKHGPWGASHLLQLSHHSTKFSLNMMTR